MTTRGDSSWAGATVPASPSTAADSEGLAEAPGDTAAEAPEVPTSMQHPLLKVLPGDGMSADDAAWATMAEAADRVLMLPGLSHASVRDLVELWSACRGAAGLPCEQHRLHDASRLPA